MLLFNSKALLPRDATQSAVMRLHVVCPSVTFRYHGHIGKNSSKIFSRPNSLSLKAHALFDRNIWAMWFLPRDASRSAVMPQ